MSESDINNSQHHDSIQETMDDVPNRGYDTRSESTDTSPINISLMTIDEIIINYLDNVIKPIVVTLESVQRVPVLYGSSERWSTFRKDGVIRDPVSGKAQTPMIMIRRKSHERGELSNPVNKYLETSFESGWNKRNAYDKFAVLNNIRPSREFHTVIIPDYINIIYDVVVWTEYEEQMSHLLSQIQVESDDYWGVRNNFKFKVKIDNMDSQSELESMQDRVVRTQFSMKINAYLIPERVIQKAKIVSTNRKVFTKKKVITMIEIDGTGNQG